MNVFFLMDELCVVFLHKRETGGRFNICRHLSTEDKICQSFFV